MKRREFITLMGVAEVSLPVAARAQQTIHRVGWLDQYDQVAPEAQAIRSAMREGLADLGWIEGRNLKLDERFAAGDFSRIRAYAAELVALVPDVLITPSAATTRALQQTTQTFPIVFAGGGDATANGLVRNITRPEGNTTGFSGAEPSTAGKRLELLKEAAPFVSRVLIVFKPEIAPTAPNYIASIEAAARPLAVETVNLPFHNAIDLVRSIDTFAATPNGGLLMLPPPLVADRTTIIQLAVQHRLPAIYPAHALAVEGGLIAYSTDLVDQSRRAASYVDRLLRGAKVAELPVQFPTKYHLVINMKTAKALGLTVPSSLLARADEVIE